MPRIVKAVLSPAKLIVGAAVILAIGLGTGHLNLFPSHALAADCVQICDTEDCPVINDVRECPVLTDEIDVCPNILGSQTVVPSGYHEDDKGNCVPDPVAQVLGASTIADPGTPKVLADSTFTGK